MSRTPASSYLCQRRQLSCETKENVGKSREGRHHQEGIDGRGCDASRHGRRLQRNLESWPPLIRGLFHRLNQKAAEGWWRRHQFGSFDDSGTVEHRFGQFVQRSRRGAVAGKLDDLGGGFRDGRHDPRIVCRLSQGDAGSGGGWHIVHGLAHGGGSRRLGRLSRSVEIRLRLELQLQRRIAWLPRTPASPIVTQSLRHLAPPGIGILRLLRSSACAAAGIAVSATCGLVSIAGRDLSGSVSLGGSSSTINLG